MKKISVLLWGAPVQPNMLNMPKSILFIELLQAFNTLTWIVNYHIEILAYIAVSHVTAVSALITVAVPFSFSLSM